MDSINTHIWSNDAGDTGFQLFLFGYAAGKNKLYSFIPFSIFAVIFILNQNFL